MKENVCSHVSVIIASIAVALTIIILMSIGFIFKACTYSSDFDKMKQDRENIAEQVLNGGIPVSSGGIIELPDGKTELSAGGVCALVNFEADKFAVYFFEFNSGILGDARGYLYSFKTDDPSLKEKAADQYAFSNVKQIDDNWYKCSSSS